MAMKGVQLLGVESFARPVPIAEEPISVGVWEVMRHSHTGDTRVATGRGGPLRTLLPARWALMSF